MIPSNLKSDTTGRQISPTTGKDRGEVIRTSQAAAVGELMGIETRQGGGEVYMVMIKEVYFQQIYWLWQGIGELKQLLSLIKIFIAQMPVKNEQYI